MEDANCKQHLTHDTITEIFRNKHAALSGGKEARTDVLYNTLIGCLYTVYHDIFIIRSITRYRIYFRENRLEEAGEESFIKAMETFETYVARAGLEKKRPVKIIFYEFYRLIFLNQMRKVFKEPTNEFKEVFSNDNDSDNEGVKEEVSVQDSSITDLYEDIEYDWDKEFNLDCLERFLAQENNRDAKVIKWRHFEKLTSWELAEKLGVTRRFAAVLVDRCMKRLRAFMKTCKEKRDEYQH